MKNISSKIISMAVMLSLTLTGIFTASAVDQKQQVFDLSVESNREAVERVLTGIDDGEEIERAKLGITDDVNATISGEAWIKEKNTGKVIPVDVKVTTHDLGAVTRAENSPHIYVTTAVASDEKESIEWADDDVTGTSLFAKIVWMDNFGTNNQLLEVSGDYALDPNYTGRVSITDKHYSYSVDWGDIRSYEWNYSDSYVNNMRYQNIYGLYFDSFAGITINDYKELTCMVKTSIGD